MLLKITTIFTALCISFLSCQKNNVSPTPYITSEYFLLSTATSIDTMVKMHLSTDTVLWVFSLTDGDGDLGVDTTKHIYDIYIKDSRYDTGFVGYVFPAIDQTIEDPKTGLKGTCTFQFFSPNIITARPDSIHSFVGDTATFELYIMDRAGHKSNHISSKKLIMVP